MQLKPQFQVCTPDDDRACSLPAGTQCSESPDTTHSHAGLNPHYHTFQMFKFGGKCQWKYLGGKVGKGVLAAPPMAWLLVLHIPAFKGESKIMSKNLSKRKIVGYDLRRESSLDRLYLTSSDDLVWYEDINEKYQDQLSGINLFFTDPTDIYSLILPADARVAAFDLPVQRVVELINGTVSNPEPLPALNVDLGWDFMGFDIVDALTQTSAFHGFDITTGHFHNAKEKDSIRFNSLGLIDDEDALSAAAELFNNLMPEHAPFSPCGIWLKQAD